MPVGAPNVNTDGQATFLEIVRRYVQDCGIDHTGTKPLTVVNQIGELKRAVDNIAESWFMIQQFRQDWKFKRYSVSFPTVDGQMEYTRQEIGLEGGTFGRWIRDSFRNYHTATGFRSEMFMKWLSYEAWRDQYKFSTFRTTKSQPQHWTNLPVTEGIGLGLPPLAGYTVIGDYYTAPIRMSVDEDVPELPAKHSFMLIVYHAMETYGYYEAAPEVIANAKKNYRRLLRALLNDQLPDIGLGGAIA